MNRIARIEVIAALASLGLAIAVSLYLVVSVLVAHEACYGMRASHLQCEAVSPGAAARLVVVLPTVLVLYAAGAAGAWWHVHAREDSARSTAFGLIWGISLILLGMVVPALSGPGFYLAPSTVLMLAAAIAATVTFIQGLRAKNQSGALDQHATTPDRL